MTTTLRTLAAAALCAISATACAPSPPAEPAEPENLPPVANLTVDGTLELGFSVYFTANGSYDPDGRIVSARLDLGDGHSMTLPSPGSGVAEFHNYRAVGTYTATLTVTDDDGATGTVSKEITIVPSDDGLPD